jgi:hypothetical protein
MRVTVQPGLAKTLDPIPNILNQKEMEVWLKWWSQGQRPEFTPYYHHQKEKEIKNNTTFTYSTPG